MSEDYIVRDAGWIVAGKRWPSHQVKILCEEDIGKHRESIEAYSEARKTLERAGLLFRLMLYDDGEQEPFLVFENSGGGRVCVFVKSLTRESLSQLDVLKAIEAVTES